MIIENFEIWEHLKDTDKPILLYGMGDGADKILDRCKEYGIKISGVFASDDFVRHQKYKDFIVSSFDEARDTFGNFTVLVSFGSSLENVISNINRISGICETYAPDVPVYGSGTFNRKYYLDNAQRFEGIYSILSDDISKHTFESIINYKLTGKLQYLFSCETDYSENYALLNLKQEKYLDLGAYNGDTVIKFASLCPDYKSIIAVEPDRRTYKKLTDNTKNLKNTVCVNKCIHDKDGTVRFEMNSGRNSKLSSNGVLTDCITIDTLCPDGVTFIKFDVEGNELNAIEGGKKTITTFKPKLKVACYHKNEDLFSIPEKILSINPDYKVYLRHNPYIPAWDTDYYFL